jgi:23S rRNA A2030 N6-methylase RlmJ
MVSIGIGEIQKNISIFKNITETLQIVDKRKKEVLAIVYPVKQKSIVKNLSGKYKNRIQKSNLSLEKIKEISMMKAIKEKYGLSS